MIKIPKTQIISALSGPLCILIGLLAAAFPWAIQALLGIKDGILFGFSALILVQWLVFYTDKFPVQLIVTACGGICYTSMCYMGAMVGQQEISFSNAVLFYIMLAIAFFLMGLLVNFFTKKIPCL